MKNQHIMLMLVDEFHLRKGAVCYLMIK